MGREIGGGGGRVGQESCYIMRVLVKLDNIFLHTEISVNVIFQVPVYFMLPANEAVGYGLREARDFGTTVKA